jgi:C4-dicarboxylate transporter, DctQ subunit
VKNMGTVFDRFVNWLAVFAGILLIFMMFLVDSEVTIRQFGQATSWTEEVASYALLFILFLGAAWLLREDGYVSFDILYDRLSPRAKAVLNIATSIFGMLLWLVVTAYALVVTIEQFQMGLYVPTLLQPPTYILLAIIPLSGITLIIQFARRTNKYVKMYKAGPSASEVLNKTGLV